MSLRDSSDFAVVSMLISCVMQGREIKGGILSVSLEALPENLNK